MKKYVRKIASLLLAVAIGTAALSGCQQNVPGSDAAASAPTTITVDGQQVEVPYVMKVDGKEVPLDLYRYFYLSIKKQIDQGDDSYWDTHAEEQDDIKSAVLDNIRGYYANQKMADTYGVTLDETDEKNVDTQVDYYMNQNYEGDEAKFQEGLKEQYLTKDLFRQMMASSLLQQKVASELMNSTTGKYLTTEDEMKEILNNEYIHATHILLKTGTDDDEAQKQKAEEALAKAQAGENFDALVEEYGEDPGMEENPDGYYFTDGMMLQPFYDAASQLQENEISGIVETTAGYHIIKRLPLDEDYINENIDNLITQHRQLLIQKEYSDIQESLTIEYGPQYDQINVDTLQ